MQKKYLLIIALFMIQAALMQPAGAVSSVSLQGSGSSFVNPVMQNWVTLFAQKSNGPVQIAYSSVGSGSGKTNFISNTTQFAGSDAPLSSTESTTISGQGRVALTLPDTSGGIVMIYNIPGLVGHLNLTAKNIADIYQGTVTTWNDASITTNNPGLASISNTITQVHRSDSSGTSFAFSNFLSLSSSDWTHGTTQDLSGLSGIGGSHNDGVAAAVKSNTYSIGYVELNYAVQSSLNFASVQNRDGYWITNSSSAVEVGVAAAANQVATTLPAGNGNWSSVTINWEHGNTTYPIATFTYLMVWQDMTGSAYSNGKGAALVAFLQWLMTDGAQDVAVPLGYVALPQSVRNADLTSINSIQYTGDWHDYWSPTIIITTVISGQTVTQTLSNSSSSSSSNTTTPGFEFVSVVLLVATVGIIGVIKRKNLK